MQFRKLNIGKYGVFLFVVVVISFHSCKKKTNTVKILGTVSDPYRNEVIENANVEFRAQRMNNGTWSNSFTLLDESTSDGSGFFEVEAENALTNSYKVVITKDGHFKGEYEFIPDAIPVNQPFEHTFDFYAEAFVTYRIWNYWGAQTFASIQQTSLNPDCKSCCVSNFGEFHGNQIDTTFTCKVYGGQNYKVEGYALNGANQIPISVNVLSIEFDSTYVEVKY